MKYYIKDKNNNINEIEETNIIQYLYNKLGIIAKEKYNDKEYKHIKKNISLLESDIPLFDIYSQNIYIIKPENLYYRITESHYRFPNKKIINLLINTLNTLKKNNSNINNYYIEKLNKNIRFLSNFNLVILKKTFYKLFYLYNPNIKELTNCLKPSFIPFLKSNPYYTKSELINLGLNMNLNIKKIDTEKICKKIKENDINSKIILQHQIYIEQNVCKSYIQLYTLLGSFYWNSYLRNNDRIQDIFLEKQINNLYYIIERSPAFDKDYYLYRFIQNDSYLSHLKIGDLFEETSFISTTRNPFYDPKNNYFGFILIKIKIPKNIEGIGLMIETYSLFPKEEEILLNPSILKLISINNDFYYYHPNSNASNMIKKKYEFQFIETIKNKPTTFLNYKNEYNPIPTLNFLNMKLNGNDFTSKVYYFYNNILPKYNDARYFYTEIENNIYLFQVFYLDYNPIYEKYFFIQQYYKKNEIYFILQDENTGQIILLIEIRDIISVNYISKFVGSKDIFSDYQLIKFISILGHFFGISDIIIHNSYESYYEISKKLLNTTLNSVIQHDNPDNHIISLYSGDFTFYNKDIIQFMNLNFDKFKNIPGLTCNLKKHVILSLKKINVIDLFVNIDKSPLYYILIKTNKNMNFLDFYLFIHNNYFYLLSDLINIIVRFNNDIFPEPKDNPFLNTCYYLSSQQFLYESNIIPFITIYKTNIYNDYIYKLNNENKKISENRYRSII
jgi:hypothetical protein